MLFRSNDKKARLFSLKMDQFFSSGQSRLRRMIAKDRRMKIRVSSEAAIDVIGSIKFFQKGLSITSVDIDILHQARSAAKVISPCNSSSAASDPITSTEIFLRQVLTLTRADSLVFLA